VDRTNLAFAVAGGLLEGADQVGVIAQATQAFEFAAQLSSLPVNLSPDQEEFYLSVSAGVKYEGIVSRSDGCNPLLSSRRVHQRPVQVRTNVRDSFAAQHLLEHVAVGRLAAFGNGTSLFPFLILLNSALQISSLPLRRRLSKSPALSRKLYLAKSATSCNLSPACGPL
jgi:hypothetical protein